MIELSTSSENIGATFSASNYKEYRESNNGEIFEKVVSDLMLNKYSDDHELTLYILSLPKEKQRMAILSIIDGDNLLWSKMNSYVNECSDKFEHIKDVIKIMSKFVKDGEVEKKKFGEVMTPITLVREMLDTLPKEVWSNPDLKWLDPANGAGTFPYVVIYKLMNGLSEWEPDTEKRYKHIVENMIYTCELQSRNVFLWLCGVDPKDEYTTNSYWGSFLDEGFDFHMKNVWGLTGFDIIVGNPPYQEVNLDMNRKPGGTNLYMKFIKKSIEFTNYLLFITPLSWMAPGNARSVNKFFFNDNFSKNTLLFLESGTSEKYFNGVGSKFSYFLLKKGKENTITKLKTSIDNNIVLSEIDLSKINNLFFLPILPNDVCINIFNKIIYSTTDKLKFKLDLEYDIRRNIDIREFSNKYPFKVYNTGTQIRYSDFKTKSYEKKKVIISGSGNLNPFYNDGDCATANNTLYMLVNSREEGESLVRLLKSKLFRFILNNSKYSGFFTKEVIWSLPNVSSIVENDNDVYRYFYLNNEEIELIEKIIK